MAELTRYREVTQRGDRSISIMVEADRVQAGEIRYFWRGGGNEMYATEAPQKDDVPVSYQDVNIQAVMEIMEMLRQRAVNLRSHGAELGATFGGSGFGSTLNVPNRMFETHIALRMQGFSAKLSPGGIITDATVLTAAHPCLKRMQRGNIMHDLRLNHKLPPATDYVDDSGLFSCPLCGDQVQMKVGTLLRTRG